MSKGQIEPEELILRDWIPGSFKEEAKRIAQSPRDIAVLFELNRHPNRQVAWRSAYLLDLAHDVDQSILDAYLKRMMLLTPKLTNDSIKRHYLRILAQHDLSETADGNLLDCCMKWLQNEETPIAVKAHCMQILYNLTKPYPELIPELKAVLENLLSFGSVGEVNRARKILSLLRMCDV